MSLIGQFIASNLEAVLASLGALAATLGAFWAGGKRVENKQLKDAQKRERAGRDAVKDHHAQERDDSPDAIVDRMRRRDGDSRGL